jgi:hypothetical protein
MSLKSGMMSFTIASLLTQGEHVLNRKKKAIFDLRDTERWFFDVMLAKVGGGRGRSKRRPKSRSARVLTPPFSLARVVFLELRQPKSLRARLS